MTLGKCSQEQRNPLMPPFALLLIRKCCPVFIKLTTFQDPAIHCLQACSNETLCFFFSTDADWSCYTPTIAYVKTKDSSLRQCNNNTILWWSLTKLKQGYFFISSKKLQATWLISIYHMITWEDVTGLCVPYHPSSGWVQSPEGWRCFSASCSSPSPFPTCSSTAQPSAPHLESLGSWLSLPW